MWKSKFYVAFIVASSSTPSTRRLLDGVAVPVPYRSTSPTHWLISTQGAAQAIADRAGYSTGFKQQILEPDEQPRPLRFIILAVPP